MTRIMHATKQAHSPTCPGPDVRPRRRSRPAYILVIVLGLTVLVTSLGVAFLEANSTAMPEAFNRLCAARAQYLAESGVNIATHFLMYPPTTVPAGQYWTGADGLAIDNTADYTNVSIVRDLSDETLFTITALGIAHDFDGNPRGKHRVSAQVVLPDDGKWHIPYALLTGEIHIPSSIEVNGDIHANGDLLGQGRCKDNVSATGTAVWAGSGPPASVSSNAEPFTAPVIDPALYAAYAIDGVSYAAYPWPGTTLSDPESQALNAIDMSATNPGRVILVADNLVLKANVRLTGTLVVAGNLTLENGCELTAVPGFPALVVSGNIDFKRDKMVAAITGSVLCHGNIEDANMKAVTLDVLGACILDGGFSLKRSDGTYRFIWDADRSTFWNFELSGEKTPITLLNWKEN